MSTPRKKRPTTPRQAAAHAEVVGEELRKVSGEIFARRIAAAEERVTALSKVRGVLADVFAGASRIKVVVDIDGMPSVEFELLTLTPPLHAIRGTE